jgi:hypothetical protein
MIICKGIKFFLNLNIGITYLHKLYHEGLSRTNKIAPHLFILIFILLSFGFAYVRKYLHKIYFKV